MVTSDRAAHYPDDHNSGRRRLPAAERRETILIAASEVFCRAGYRAAKVADVAALVGVTEPVIFQNFGSKSALYAAVMQRAVEHLGAMLDGLVAGSGSASSLLAHVLAGSAHARLDDGDHAGASYGVLFADAVALAAQPEMIEPARDAVRAIVEHLVVLIRRAQADGSVRSDVDPEAAGWLLLSVLSSRRLRDAAMPADLEPVVNWLALHGISG